MRLFEEAYDLFICCLSLCRAAETGRQSQMVTVCIRECIERGKKEKTRQSRGRKRRR